MFLSHAAQVFFTRSSVGAGESPISSESRAFVILALACSHISNIFLSMSSIFVEWPNIAAKFYFATS
jgi:hypothetical protein